MKRKFIALFITLVLTFAFSANCFALPSPTEKPIKPTTSQTVTVKPASDKDGNWSKGDKKGLTFVINVKLDKNTTIYVDGKVLDASDYVVKNNKIILSADFLASLSCGKHTLTVKTSIGTASCDFYISENGETVAPNNKSVSPKTADNGNYVLIPVALISALFLGIMLLGRKRITE